MPTVRRPAAALAVVAAERTLSAIERAWSAEEQACHLEAFSAREAFHVAVEAEQGVVGDQALDLWSPLLSSMSHVAPVGNFLLPEWRGRGVGQAL